MSHQDILDYIEQKHAEAANQPKRGRGRPAGSKNLTEAEREARYLALHPRAGSGSGRPKGSLNKPKTKIVRPVQITIGKTVYEGIEYINGSHEIYVAGTDVPPSWKKSHKTRYAIDDKVFMIAGVNAEPVQYWQLKTVVASDDTKIMNAKIDYPVAV